MSTGFLRPPGDSCPTSDEHGHRRYSDAELIEMPNSDMHGRVNATVSS
jgi:hypothetical protein